MTVPKDILSIKNCTLCDCMNVQSLTTNIVLLNFLLTVVNKKAQCFSSPAPDEAFGHSDF